MRPLKSMSLSLLFINLVVVKPTRADSDEIDRMVQWKEIQALYAQIQQKEKEFLMPSAEDMKSSPTDLESKSEGLIRLLPREIYDDKLSIRGGGAYYSFTRLTHAYGYGSDIELSQNEFSVGFAGCDFGFFVDTKELNIKNVTLDHPSAKALVDFQVAKGEPEIRKQQAMREWKANDWIYDDRIKVKLQHVYILRSINFDESDVLVAVQPLRFDTDRSLILAWKLLKLFETSTCR